MPPVRTLERLGFQREGFLRERWQVNGEIQDAFFTACSGLTGENHRTQHLSNLQRAIDLYDSNSIVRSNRDRYSTLRLVFLSAS